MIRPLVRSLPNFTHLQLIEPNGIDEEGEVEQDVSNARRKNEEATAILRKRKCVHKISHTLNANWHAFTGCQIQINIPTNGNSMKRF